VVVGVRIGAPECHLDAVGPFQAEIHAGGHNGFGEFEHELRWKIR
jgi:hypothetical protein